MANYSICTQTFDIGDEPKAKALKPLEEAAEVFGAWQNRCDEDVVDELADLKRGASRSHHPECAYFGRDENDCDQCEAVCSFACKKIAFGDIESRIRKLLEEDK